MRLCISIRGCVRPSVGPCHVFQNRQKIAVSSFKNPFGERPLLVASVGRVSGLVFITEGMSVGRMDVCSVYLMSN